MFAAFAPCVRLRLLAGRQVKCQRKQKKSNDQRAPVTRYHQIKEIRLLDMISYLVIGGLHFLGLPRYQNLSHSYLIPDQKYSQGDVSGKHLC